jgi:hypothetical protein
MGAICDRIWRRFRSENLRTNNRNRNLRKREDEKEEQEASSLSLRSFKRARERSRASIAFTPWLLSYNRFSFLGMFTHVASTVHTGRSILPPTIRCVHTYTWRWPLFMASLHSHLYPLTCRWPLYRIFLRTHLDNRLTGRQMASLYGFFAFTLTSRFPLTVNGVFAWPLCVHTYT